MLLGQLNQIQIGRASSVYGRNEKCICEGKTSLKKMEEDAWMEG
jgi:hypothetical protein